MSILNVTEPTAIPTEGHTHLIVVSSLGERILQEVPGAALYGATAIGLAVQVPWTQEVCEYLGAIRAPVVPRMLVDYAWSNPDPAFKVMPHQYRMAGMLAVWRRGFLLGEPAVGKTLAGLWAIDYLLKTGRARRALIVTLKGIMRPAWQSDINEHLPWMEHTVVYSADAKRRRTLARRPTPVHITNYQTAELCHDELMANKYDIVLLDESTAIKTHTTRRWRFLFPILEQAPFAWCLTGTPTTQAPTDAYGQVLAMYGRAWKMSAERWKQLTMMQVSQHKWVPVTNHLEVVKAAMQPAIVVRKRDVLPDLPEISHRTIEVDLTTEQATAMKALRTEALALLQSGVEITAVHGAALRSKLVQIASGAVRDADGGIHEVDYKPRISEAIEWVRKYRAMDDDLSAPPSNKVIIFCAFKAVAARVQKDMIAAGFRTALVTGDSSEAQRNAILNKTTFNRTRETEVVVAVPEVMSHGLTLTSANLTIWFTPYDKAEVVVQANNRMDRPGQRNPMFIVRLCGSPAEQIMYKTSSDRIDTHNTFMGSFKQLVDVL